MDALDILQVTTDLPYLLLRELGLLEEVVDVGGDDEVVLDLWESQELADRLETF